ncbi:hypothetical protein [Dyadobacter sp.]|uniref:hypothetical protein n=1 Tax=Dyadobacter sp. TaxID=1914288 RepID=UPI003F6F28AE
MKKTILIALICASTFACTKNEVAAPQEKAATTIVPYRQLTTVPTTGDDLKVDLREVTDSRCPKNVVCIQMGDAKVKFNVSDGKNATDVDLAFKGDKRTDFQTFTLSGQNYVLSVNEVLPYPETSQSPKLEDYKVNVSIEKK